MLNRLLIAVLALTVSGCQYVRFEDSLSKTGIVIAGEEFAGAWKEVLPADDPFGPSPDPVVMKIALNADQTCTVSFPAEPEYDRSQVTGRLVSLNGKTYFEVVFVEQYLQGRKTVLKGPDQIEFCNLLSVSREGDELLVSLPKVEKFRVAVFDSKELEGRRIDHFSNQIAVTSNSTKLEKFLSENHDRVFSEPCRFRLVTQQDVPEREQVETP